MIATHYAVAFALSLIPGVRFTYLKVYNFLSGSSFETSTVAIPYKNTINMFNKLHTINLKSILIFLFYFIVLNDFAVLEYLLFNNKQL